MERNLLKYSLVILGLALCTCSAAFGLAFRTTPHTPEINPSLAIGGLTMLAGTIAVLRIRHKK